MYFVVNRARDFVVERNSGSLLNTSRFTANLKDFQSLIDDLYADDCNLVAHATDDMLIFMGNIFCK